MPTSITPEIWQALSEIRATTQKQFGETIQNEWRSYNVTYTAQPPYYACVNFSLEGYDDPTIACVVLARPTQSHVAF